MLLRAFRKRAISLTFCRSVGLQRMWARRLNLPNTTVPLRVADDQHASTVSTLLTSRSLGKYRSLKDTQTSNADV